MRKINRKLYKRLMLVGIICLFSCNVCFAADTVAGRTLLLTQEEAVSRAIETSESYQISHNQVQNLQERYKEVRAQILPHINDESSWTYNASFPEDKINDYDVVNTITGSQVLWAFGRIRSAINAAQKASQIGSLDKEAARRDVVYTTKLAYYTVLLAEDTFTIIEESYNNAVEHKRILEERSAKGRVSKRDNIKISADVAARIPQMSNARAQFKAALNTLKIMIGLSFEESIELHEKYKEHYDSLDYNKLEAALMLKEPSLKALAETVILKDEVIQQRKAEYLPAIFAFGSYSYKGGDNSATIGSNNLDSYSAAGVKVSIPLFNGFETTAKLAQARIDKYNSELLLQQGLEQRTLELHNAVSDYHEFIETLAANNDAVRLAQESFLLSQELFTTGQISVTDLNDAELQLTNQKLAREQTLFNINVTHAHIEKLTNTEGES